MPSDTTARANFFIFIFQSSKVLCVSLTALCLLDYIWVAVWSLSNHPCITKIGAQREFTVGFKSSLSGDGAS